MPVVSWRVDEESLTFFLRYCDLNGLTKQEGFRNMVEVFRATQPIQREEATDQPQSKSRSEWYYGGKKDITAHVHRCFVKYGGELQKAGRCFFVNENFVIYMLYRALSKDESKVVKMTGNCVKQLEAIAQATGKTPLIAVLAKPEGATPFYGILPLHSIKTVLVEAGSRNAGYPFFRRKNGESLKEKINEEDAVFIHIRNEADRKAIWEACGSSDDRAEWASEFYGHSRLHETMQNG